MDTPDSLLSSRSRTERLSRAQAHDYSGSARFSVLLRGGTVFDGLGNAPITADVGIVGERVVAVGDLSQASADTVLDVSDCFVAPGFIDIHTHSDISILSTPDMNSSLAQGVTAEVFGNCGLSLGFARPSVEFGFEKSVLERSGITLDWQDMGSFLNRIQHSGTAIHVATLAGHGTLRKRVMGSANRKPDAAEMAEMQRELANALEAGAIGLSSGLEYVPGMYADVAELTELAKIARDAGGFYATHLRDEGDALEEAVAEAITVAERAQIPLQLSHHKAERPRNWGKVVRTLAMVDAAQGRGLDVLLDQYPYSAYQTGLATIAIPSWAASTPELLAKLLRDPEVRARVLVEMNGVDWSAVEIASCPSHRDYQGQKVSTLAAQTGQDPREWVLDLLSEGEGFIAAAHFAMSETDVERVLSDRRVMIGSDAIAFDPSGPASMEKPHPRTYGTFARIFAHYVRERGLLTWQEAIRRMTSLPATRLNWPERGRLVAGAFADITVFHPNTITDTATFAAPHSLASGVEYVFVNGTLTFAQGRPTGQRNGQVLRRSATRSRA